MKMENFTEKEIQSLKKLIKFTDENGYYGYGKHFPMAPNYQNQTLARRGRDMTFTDISTNPCKKIPIDIATNSWRAAIPDGVRTTHTFKIGDTMRDESLGYNNLPASIRDTACRCPASLTGVVTLYNITFNVDLNIPFDILIRNVYACYNDKGDPCFKYDYMDTHDITSALIESDNLYTNHRGYYYLDIPDYDGILSSVYVMHLCIANEVFNILRGSLPWYSIDEIKDVTLITTYNIIGAAFLLDESNGILSPEKKEIITKYSSSIFDVPQLIEPIHFYGIQDKPTNSDKNLALTFKDLAVKRGNTNLLSYIKDGKYFWRDDK